MADDFVDPIDRNSTEWEFTLAFHRAKCHLNHTDQCGFGYPRQVDCNRRWMEKAEEFRTAVADYLPLLDITELTFILQTFTDAKTY